MSVLVEDIAASALRRFLLRWLPSKVAEVNATRAAVLESTGVEPFVVTSGMKLQVCAESPAAPAEVTLTTGSRTAAQVAADINGVVLGAASADADGRLLISGSAPLSSTSYAGVASDLDGSGNSTGANALFGWDAGGEGVTRAPLVAPGYRGVADGWPLLNDLGRGFWVIIGDRESVPVQPSLRKDEHLVALELGIFCPVTNEQVHRDREAIQACVRCVRELVLTDAGRQFGRAAHNDVMLAEEKSARIPGRPWKFRGNDAPNALFDVAALQLNVRVFERPASS